METAKERTARLCATYTHSYTNASLLLLRWHYGVDKLTRWGRSLSFLVARCSFVQAASQPSPARLVVQRRRIILGRIIFFFLTLLLTCRFFPFCHPGWLSHFFIPLSCRPLPSLARDAFALAELFQHLAIYLHRAAGECAGSQVINKCGRDVLGRGC